MQKRPQPPVGSILLLLFLLLQLKLMYNAEDIKYLLGQRCSEPGEHAASGGHGKKTNPMKSCLCFKVLITPLQLGRGVRGGLSALEQGQSCWNDPLEAAPDHSLPKADQEKELRTVNV